MLFFTQRNVYTHVLLHRKSFDTEYPLHREAFAQILLRGFFNAQIHLYRGVFETQTIHRYFYKRGVLHGYFYTEVLLRTGAFRTRTLLGRGTFAWVRLGTRFTGGFKPFWTEAAIQPHLYAYTQVRLLQGDAFAHKCSYTGPSHRDGLKKEMILQRDASTRRCSYTEILSTQMPLHTGA